MILTTTICYFFAIRSESVSPPPLRPSASETDDVGSFLVMGDWGGLPYWPYYSPAEKGIAKAMGILAHDVNATYTLALGDNFYFDGVKDVKDTRFKETFENVFDADSLQNERHFRVLGGNHDHYGNISAEIAYTNVSSRWYFPILVVSAAICFASSRVGHRHKACGVFQSASLLLPLVDLFMVYVRRCRIDCCVWNAVAN